MNTKTITVAVQIQMDIINEENALEQVKNALEAVNNAIYTSEIDAQPQIFISDISESDIIEDED